jgi:hypothetical protein
VLRASALLLALWAGTAHAHPAAAEPPLFAPGSCVTVVDKSAEPFVALPYAVAFDDVEFTDGDIRLPDAKTHQFFALRGALVWSTAAVELVPFEASDGPELRLPLPPWISELDVQRAAAAIEGSGTMFTAGEVLAHDVLDTSTALQGRALRIDADDARRPITIGAADGGAAWFLASVEPGLYSIATYIFSPPYNGWAVRPGLVHVVRDATAAASRPPSGVLEPVTGVLRSFQGRRVRACIDAPPGSTVRGEAFALARPELGWVQWHEPTPLTPQSDTLELCYRSPFEGSGAVRVRLVLRGADGREITAYSPDTLTALAGEGTCQENDQVCCPPAAEPRSTPGCATALAAGAERAIHPAKPLLACLILLHLWRRRSRRRRVALCSAPLGAACLHLNPSLANFAGGQPCASAAPTTSSRRWRG